MSDKVRVRDGEPCFLNIFFFFFFLAGGQGWGVERERGRERSRGRGKESLAGSVLSTEPDMGF